MSQALEYVQYHYTCEACSRARQIENARLAWRDLYNTGNPIRTRMGFAALAAYGSAHYGSEALCYSCQEYSVRNNKASLTKGQ